MTEIRLYRDGLAEALRHLPFVSEALTAADGATAVTMAHAGCDVVLMDMSLPRCADAVQAVLTARPGVRVVALGVPDGGAEVVGLAEAGIAGYVSREASLEELGEALRAVERGEAACSGKVAALLLRHIAREARRRSDPVPRGLTPREREVLHLLQNGMSNKQIARALDLQLSTVKNHVHNLIAKFGATGRLEVAAVSSGPRSSVGDRAGSGPRAWASEPARSPARPAIGIQSRRS